MKRHTLTILTSLLLLTGLPSFAFADSPECRADTDCNGSRICTEVKADDDTPTYRCEYPPIQSCESTNECGSGYTCVQWSISKCDTDPKSGQRVCESITESICAPPYLSPCTDDQSCSPAGFTCHDIPYFCACRPSGAGEPEKECTCPDPDVVRRGCRLVNKQCNFNTDCEADLVCILPSLHAPETPMVGHCAPPDYPYWSTGGQDTKDYERPGAPKKEKPTTDDDKNNEDPEDTRPGTPGSPRPGAGKNEQDDPKSDFEVKRIENSDGCHIASLNTGKTSTTAILLAGTAAFFTFRRRRQKR